MFVRRELLVLVLLLLCLADSLMRFLPRRKTSRCDHRTWCFSVAVLLLLMPGGGLRFAAVGLGLRDTDKEV